MSFHCTTEDYRRRINNRLEDATRRGTLGWPDKLSSLRLLDCDAVVGTVLFACDCTPSMANGLGVVHGGAIATVLDNCMGLTGGCRAGRPTPTISMTINYARPVPLGSSVRIRTRTVSLGHTTCHVSAELFLADCPDNVLVSSTGVYYTALDEHPNWL